MARFPVLKGTNQLMIVCSRAFIKIVHVQYNVQERRGKNTPTRVTNAIHRKIKISIAYTIPTMMAKDRQEKGDGGWEIKIKS